MSIIFTIVRCVVRSLGAQPIEREKIVVHSFYPSVADASDGVDRKKKESRKSKRNASDHWVVSVTLVYGRVYNNVQFAKGGFTTNGHIIAGFWDGWFLTYNKKETPLTVTVVDDHCTVRGSVYK